MIAKFISALQKKFRLRKPKPIPTNIPVADSDDKKPEENPIKAFVQNFVKESAFAAVEIFFWGFLVASGLYFYLGPLLKINFPYGVLEIFGCGAIVYALYDLLPSIINRCRFK